MTILLIAGARPNFMKIAPLYKALSTYAGITTKIVHTGQHYDEKMSDVFFRQFGLPAPHYNLEVGGGSHTYQKAHVMLKLEEVIIAEKPDMVVVVGDVNATAAGALVAVKMGIPVAHVEAGLRSYDRTMPEEINRLVTDVISDYLLVSEHSGLVNLAKEGVPDEKVFFVGNVMIDTLVGFREQSEKSDILEKLGVEPQEYILMTTHRPANVDQEEQLRNIIQIVQHATAYKKVVFSIHPRTQNNMKKFGLWADFSSINGLILTGPQGYLEFLKLMANASLILTDSGGIQEETTYLQVPCLTIRDSTERPVTVELGTNQLLPGLDPDLVKQKMEEILSGKTKKGSIPALWDGHAAERIATILINKLKT